MLIPFPRKAFRDGKLKTALAVLIATVMCLAASPAVHALVEPLPKEIKDFTMGMPAESVIQKIKESGTHTTEPVVEQNRTMIVWIPDRNPFYKEVIFGFTEKDRLFQVRFNLTAPARSNASELKKAFFGLYEFYQENPMRLRVKDSDVIMYGPGKTKHEFLIEFTDRTTGQKTFELFDRDISASDRPWKPKEEEGAPGSAPTDIIPGATLVPTAEATPQPPPSPTTTDATPAPAGKKQQNSSLDGT